MVSNRTTYTPPPRTHWIRIYVEYTYSHREGRRAGELSQKEGYRGATVYKAGSKILTWLNVSSVYKTLINTSRKVSLQVILSMATFCIRLWCKVISFYFRVSNRSICSCAGISISKSDLRYRKIKNTGSQDYLVSYFVYGFWRRRPSIARR